MDELLADGAVIRKLWIGEARKYRDHLLRLDGESRRNRFGGALADELIEAYVATAMRTGTVTHGFLVDGVLRGVAELRPFGAAFPTEAEVAFSIEKPWQSHGVGSALLERTLLAARNRGIKLVHMSCLAGNARMQQLARKFEAELSFDFGSVVGEVEAPHATPLSLFREFVADGHGFATAVLDAQARLIRPPGKDERMANGE
jgi:GNAT superfamily N-acetyltransferase